MTLVSAALSIDFLFKILPSPLSTPHVSVLIPFFLLELVLLFYIVCKKDETRMQFNTATSRSSYVSGDHANLFSFICVF